MRIVQRIFFYSLIGFLSIGCKKESADGTDYYIRFKVGGAQKEYRTTNYNRVNYVQVNGMYTAAIAGIAKTEDVPKNSINITVRSLTKIGIGNYAMQQAVEQGGFKYTGIDVTYTTETGETFGAFLLRENYPALTITNDAAVNFSSISTSETRGTFSAVLTTTDRLKELVITEGAFFLPGGQ